LLSFTSAGPPHENQVRFAETRSFRISPGYILQAEIVIGCGNSPAVTASNSSKPALPISKALDTFVELQYSVDHGKTWYLVHEVRMEQQRPAWTRNFLAESFSQQQNQTRIVLLMINCSMMGI